MRPSWNEYFADLAQKAAERSTCTRLQVGCLVVKNKQIISTGYNGSISGDEHCIDVGCKVIDGHCQRTIHAEMNAITQAARRGISLEGGVIYVTHKPCLLCTKLIIQAGIKEIYYLDNYKNNEYADELLKKARIKTERLGS